MNDILVLPAIVYEIIITIRYNDIGPIKLGSYTEPHSNDIYPTLKDAQDELERIKQLVNNNKMIDRSEHLEYNDFDGFCYNSSRRMELISNDGRTMYRIKQRRLLCKNNEE